VSTVLFVHGSVILLEYRPVARRMSSVYVATRRLDWLFYRRYHCYSPSLTAV